MRVFIALSLLITSIIVAFGGNASVPKAIDYVSPDYLLHFTDGSAAKLAGVVPIRAAADVLEPWLEQPVRMESAGHNRYGDELVFIYRLSDGALLQEALVEQEAAMVYGTEQAQIAPLLHLPTPEAAIIPEERAKERLGQWAAVTGTVNHVAVLRDVAYLNFGADYKTDFTIDIPKAALKQWSEEELKALESQPIRVRGFVHSYNGPRITLHHRAMLERMDP